MKQLKLDEEVIDNGYNLVSNKICADCKKCYNGCTKSFPEEYIDGGADKCESFEVENNSEIVEANLKRKEKEIVEKYIERGIYV